MRYKTTLLFIMTLMILLPSIINTHALTHTVNISRNLDDVYVDDIVIISIDVTDMDRESEITSARLSSFVNGIFQPSINPEQSIPQRESYLTFVMGSFLAGDMVRYKVYLEYNDAEDYVSDWFEFTLPEGSRPLLSVSEISLIIVASLLLIGIIVIIIRRIKK